MRADGTLVYFFPKEEVFTMLKKVIALLLCVLMMIPLFSSCAKRDEDDLGPMITMYLPDEIYNFDPAYAYYNSGTLSIVSMLFETLFKLDDKGVIQNALVDSYEYLENAEKNEYKMVILLKDTCWSNKDPITTDNVLYTWRRLLNPKNSFEAASLLFDIKNARAVKEGDVTIDDLGVEANSSKMLTITFEGAIDVEAFLLNLTSVATAPLPESHIEKDADWAKKGATMICSGPFKLGKTRYVNVSKEDYNTAVDKSDDVAFANRDIVKDDYALDEWGNVMTSGVNPYCDVKRLSYFVLERNSYYYRNPEEDAIDEFVVPHRLLVNCMLSAEELEAEFQNNRLFYVGGIPGSMRKNASSSVMQNVKTASSMSTFSLYLNEKALIKYKNDKQSAGEAIFAKPEVRKALSLAIDRDAIAKAVVFAKAATGIVPNGVFEAGAAQKKLFSTTEVETFRDNANNSLISATASPAAAQELLTQAGVDPEKFTFSINVACYDEINVIATEMIAESWRQLGFDVKVNKVKPIQNNDVLKAIASDADPFMKDICDDLFVESITRKTFEVLAFDYVAFSADAFSVLSGFAKPFAGMQYDMENYILEPHRTGYDSEAYNNLMEAVYYVPYFAKLNRETSQDFLGIYDTKEEFQATYDAVKAIYDQYGITPTTKVEDWKTQKATLLHKAEELLLADLPIIPVLFNEHAVAYSDEMITDMTADYYVPNLFTEAMLENYLDYTYINKQGKLTSIFAAFPEIEWEKAGYDYSPQE